jgi:hypothetical protein
MLGIALPADHPVWAAEAEPLPIDEGDTLGVVRAAGWLIAGTREDGIVRIVNHGTDHATAGSLVGDSPLYARLGYSTATSPLLDATGWEEPLEQSVSLIDGDGRATHRAAMELLDARVQDGGGGRVAIGASTSLAHWITADPSQRHHGSGLAGDVVVAGRLTVHSLVRGPWDVRVVRVDSLEGAESGTLRVGGWPISARSPKGEVTDAAAAVSADGIASGIRSLSSGSAARVLTRSNASPLGPVSSVPVLEYRVAAGDELVTLVTLTGGDAAALAAVERGAVERGAVERGADGSIAVTWPDGVATTSRLTDPRTADGAAR